MSPRTSPRVVLVTGKGGVGKTTVALALALRYAERGLSTVLVETAGAEQIPEIFGVEGQGYTPTQVAPGLWTLRLTPEEAIEDYVVQQVRFRRLYAMVFKNRVMGPFIDAVPGLHDAVQLGKIFDLHRESAGGRPRWDRIVVDAPATGHGLTMLGSARSLMDLTRAGPLHDGVKQVQDVIGDPQRTGVVLVSLPESLPVNETIELGARLGESRALLRGVVLNSAVSAPVTAGELQLVKPGLSTLPGGEQVARLAARRLRQVAAQDSAAARLRAGLGVPTVTLPDLRWGAEPVDRLGAAELSNLGGLLPLAELGL